VAQQSPLWFWCRIVLMLACVLSAPFQLKGLAIQGGFDKPSISFPFVIGGFTLFASVVLTWFQTMNPRAAEKWDRPSMHASLVSTYKQPLDMFYTGGLFLIAGGIGYLVFGISSPPVRWAWELPLPAGIGALLGVGFSVWGFQERFKPEQSMNRRQWKGR
jgi:hypothetical protein